MAGQLAGLESSLSSLRIQVPLATAIQVELATVVVSERVTKWEAESSWNVERVAHLLSRKGNIVVKIRILTFKFGGIGNLACRKKHMALSFGPTTVVFRLALALVCIRVDHLALACSGVPVDSEEARPVLLFGEELEESPGGAASGVRQPGRSKWQLKSYGNH